MREDQLIKLDEIFKYGYVVVYIQPNGNIRLALYNPLQSELLDKSHKTLLTLKQKPWQTLEWL